MAGFSSVGLPGGGIGLWTRSLRMRAVRIRKCSPPPNSSGRTHASVPQRGKQNTAVEAASLALSTIALFGGGAAMAAAEEKKSVPRISFSTKATAETALAATYDTYVAVEEAVRFVKRAQVYCAGTSHPTR